MAKKAVILLSGGIDSATVLAIAKSQGYCCHALSIDYNQRHHIELEFAKKLALSLNADEHRIIKMDIGSWGGSALTDQRLSIPHKPSNHIPNTYVPARNTIFLSTALGWAEAIGAQDIFIGANVIDYSNYPDCRPEYLRAFEQVANLATRAGVSGLTFNIHAPLIELSKSQIIMLGHSLGVNVDDTFCCYDPTADGQHCGQCDSCRFRDSALQIIKQKHNAHINI